jgi:hypothetical protein
MKIFIVLLIIGLSIFLESSLVTLSLVLGVLIMLTALTQKPSVFWISFLAGVILDIVMFHPVGASSFFFVLALGLVFLYKRKFEIQSPFFVGISVFIFSLLYGALFVHRYSFFSAVLTALGISAMYVIIIFLQKPKREVYSR